MLLTVGSLLTSLEPRTMQPLNVGAVAVQTDGRIVVAGLHLLSEALGAVFLMRFTSNGQVDSSFGNGGRVETPIGSEAQAMDMGIQRSQAGGIAGEKIVVVGHTGSGAAQDFLLLRYNSNGSLDTLFGSGGAVITDFDGRQDRAHALALGE